MASYKCPGCGFVYDEQKGVPRDGYPAGTKWETLPADWACPHCVVREKPDFIAQEPSKSR
jgi:rubredoxin